MEENRSLQAEEMLERIFYYMNQLVDEKRFFPTILLLADLGKTLVNCERTSFWYWDKEQRQYWTMAALNSQRIVVPEGSGIIGASIKNGEVIVINSPYEDVRFNSEVDKKTGYVTRSILCIPVKNARGEVIGAYQAINKIAQSEACDFTDQDVKRLTLAAAYAGKTLESHILYQQTQIDPLTRLKNRRGLEAYYFDEVSPLLGNGVVSLIMCDIDHFKKVNDVYGHNAGDAVLIRIAKLLKDSVGEMGEVVRWGGEEFVIAMLNCTEQQAVKCAERIRHKVEKDVCHFENEKIHVTMSFGVRQFQESQTLEKNIQYTDERLYIAKESGRNQVVAG